MMKVVFKPQSSNTDTVIEKTGSMWTINGNQFNEDNLSESADILSVKTDGDITVIEVLWKYIEETNLNCFPSPVVNPQDGIIQPTASEV